MTKPTLPHTKHFVSSARWTPARRDVQVVKTAERGGRATSRLVRSAAERCYQCNTAPTCGAARNGGDPV
eukprot:scaffold3582_cov335-Prasinococcus_capsulatus_cf.AAC.4